MYWTSWYVLVPHFVCLNPEYRPMMGSLYPSSCGKNLLGEDHVLFFVQLLSVLSGSNYPCQNLFLQVLSLTNNVGISWDQLNSVPSSMSPRVRIPTLSLKDTFSCGPINIKFGPHKICSISTPKPTDRTDCTVKVMWAELRKSWKCGTRRQNCGYCSIMNHDLVKMTSWDCQEGNRASIPNFSSYSMHTISPYWGSGIWKPIEILLWMHLLCSTTPTQ